ncbi:SDR family oxidoreductase [Streptomyces roseirectus]|uniref:SDR family oxidoreductase n=1 Tax=Streptomyces roseirectus TaxID=2768066 RepID=A0A7H0IA96_9ACTN|nr:SDR family oxidoreductase [Streptomyces roseirectus]QNP69712.1 SDR family oxidoreductase [Streptomyces roseirectus]
MTVIVITGGSRGIGLGLAHAFASRGCHVVICGRDETSVTAAAEQSGALGVPADVTSRADVRRLWDTATERFGRVDHWINNAGIALAPRLLHDIPEDDVRRLVDVNLVGAINGCAVAVERMLDQGGGFVWNMVGFGSNGRVSRGMAPYGSTKRALAYLHDTLTLEAKGTPVRIGLLSPGLVVTELVAGNDLRSDLRGRRQQVYYEVLSDPLDVVAPWLATRVLSATRNGTRAERLTGPKACGRLATALLRGRLHPALRAT